MKKLAVLVVAVAAVGAAFAGPSEAAGPYTIAGPAPVFVDGANRFKLNNCDPAMDGGPTDGIDSQIVNVSGRGLTVLNITWSAESTATGSIPGTLSAAFYSGNCTYLNTNSVVSQRPGAWAVPVPAGTVWMVVVSTAKAQVSFSFP